MKQNVLLPLTLGVILALALSACGPAPASLDGTSWILAEMDGQPPLPDRGISLSFSGGRVSGTACNHYNGSYYQSADRLTFGPLMSTLMLCVDEGVMDQESAYLLYLNGTARFELRDGQLWIFPTAGGTLVFVPAE